MRHNHLVTIKKQSRWILYCLAFLFFNLASYHVYTLFILKQQMQNTLISATQRTTQIQTLADRHLFGISMQTKDLPLSNLALNLQGISFLGKHNSENSAIIGQSSAAAKSYHVGDNLPFGAIIKAILPKQVNIEHNGQLERLVLPKTNLEEYHNEEALLPS